MAGAPAEDDFVAKLANAGFADVEVLQREPLDVDDCALYPLFTDDVITLMKRLIPTARQHTVAIAIVVRAYRRRAVQL